MTKRLQRSSSTAANRYHRSDSIGALLESATREYFAEWPALFFGPIEEKRLPSTCRRLSDRAARTGA